MTIPEMYDTDEEAARFLMLWLGLQVQDGLQAVVTIEFIGTSASAEKVLQGLATAYLGTSVRL